jgi:hypothetical protein
LPLVLAIPMEMSHLLPFLPSAFRHFLQFGKAFSFLLPTLVSQLRDISGTFLLSMIVLAIVGEDMFMFGLRLSETGGKTKINAKQD